MKSIIERGCASMKKSMKLLVLTAALAVGMAIQAYGAEGTAITSIPLTFSWDTAPKGGEQVGEIYVATSSTQFIVEGAEYDKRDDAWIFGEQPIVEVELSAKDGYYFSDSSRSSFSLSGCNAQYRSSEVDSDGNVMILRVTLSRLDGSLPGTTSISWSGDSAVWDEVGGSDGYDVRLYRDNRLLATVSTEGTSYDFHSYLNLEGDYTFTVRATGDYSTQDSGWSASSEPKTITLEESWSMDTGSWQRNGSRWRYVYANGAYPVSAWRQIGDAWYYFDTNGYMVSNCYVKSLTEEMYYWINRDGVWDTQWDTAQPERGYGVYS